MGVNRIRDSTDKVIVNKIFTLVRAKFKNAMPIQYIIAQRIQSYAFKSICLYHWFN